MLIYINSLQQESDNNGRINLFVCKINLQARQPKPKYGYLAVRARLETNAPPIVERRTWLIHFCFVPLTWDKVFILIKPGYLQLKALGNRLV